jgi:2-iminobutanoate/2-iminopropanoate deaminase
MAGGNRGWQPVAAGGDAPPPAGAYSPAVRAGDFVFVSGQVPRDPRTGQVGGGDFAAQTRLTLDNLRAVLEAAGARLDDVTAVTVYLADIGNWEAFNAIYRDTFRPPYPSRTVVGAQLHGFLVEISAVAYVRAVSGER